MKATTFMKPMYIWVAALAGCSVATVPPIFGGGELQRYQAVIGQRSEAATQDVQACIKAAPKPAVQDAYDVARTVSIRGCLVDRGYKLYF